MYPVDVTDECEQEGLKCYEGEADQKAQCEAGWALGDGHGSDVGEAESFPAGEEKSEDEGGESGDATEGELGPLRGKLCGQWRSYCEDDCAEEAEEQDTSQRLPGPIHGHWISVLRGRESRSVTEVEAFSCG